MDNNRPKCGRDRQIRQALSEFLAGVYRLVTSALWAMSHRDAPADARTDPTETVSIAAQLKSSASKIPLVN